MAYEPGERALDYRGARIHARVNVILTEGEKIDAIRQVIMERLGAEKAWELRATVNCTITRVRPVVDRGQRWDEAPF